MGGPVFQTTSPATVNRFNAVPTTRIEGEINIAQGNNLGATSVDPSTLIAGEDLGLNVLGVTSKPVNDTTYQATIESSAALVASKQATAAATPYTVYSFSVQVGDATLPSGTYTIQCANSTAIPAEGAFTANMYAPIRFDHEVGVNERVDFRGPENGMKAALSFWVWVSTSADSYTKLLCTTASFIIQINGKA